MVPASNIPDIENISNPGDAIYMPAGWWRHVRANAPLIENLIFR